MADHFDKGGSDPGGPIFAFHVRQFAPPGNSRCADGGTRRDDDTSGMKGQDGKRLTITIDEAARRLGICRNSAYEAAKRGELPSIRLGGRVLVPVAALESMLESAGKTPGPAASNDRPTVRSRAR